MDGCLPDGTNCGNGPNVTPADPAVLGDSNTPSFLESVTKARQFLYGDEGMMQSAINQGRYFPTQDAAKSSAASLGASNPDGVLTFVDGDLTLGPGSPTGQGTLIVTGNLTLDGNFNWNGVIMVLGGGSVYRNGGGHGNMYGALFVAKFTKTGADYRHVSGARIRHIRWRHIQHSIQLKRSGHGQGGRRTRYSRRSRIQKTTFKFWSRSGILPVL